MWYEVNPLSAGAFFWPFFKTKISKICLCNAISQEWINQNTKFYIPFCRRFQALCSRLALKGLIHRIKYRYIVIILNTKLEAPEDLTFVTKFLGFNIQEDQRQQ